MTGVNKTLEQCRKRLVEAGVDFMSLEYRQSQRSEKMSGQNRKKFSTGARP
jgi:hypothetical protein